MASVNSLISLDFFQKSALIKQELTRLGCSIKTTDNLLDNKIEEKVVEKEVEQIESHEEVSEIDEEIDFESVDLEKLKATNEIDAFIGDISLEERKVIFSLWKLLDRKIGCLDSFNCPQCQKSFSGRSHLLQHLAASCTNLLEDFFYQAEDFFSSKLTEISSDWNIMDAFELLKEKTVAFLDHRWCLLCGKTTPINVWSSNNTGSFLTNHIIHAHLKKEILVHCQSPSSKNKPFQCLAPNQTTPNQMCGFKCKSQALLFDHLGNFHSLVDFYLRLIDDVSTVNGTAPVTDKVPSKCNNCGKRFANKLTLKIHRAAEQKELVEIKKDNPEMRCGYGNCAHTAKFSDEEIIRHFGLLHLNLSKSKAKAKLLQPRPNTFSQNGHLVPYIAPLEIKTEDDIIEIPVPKKVIEVIDLDLDDEKEIEGSDKTAFENKPSLSDFPMKSRTNDQLGTERNSGDLISLEQSPSKVTKNKYVQIGTMSNNGSRTTSSSWSCPVCNAPFLLISELHQHLSIIHFYNRLTALVPALHDKGFMCPDPQCSFAHISRHAVVDHISMSHLMAFDIAKQIFSDFSLPLSGVHATSFTSSTKVASSRVPPTKTPSTQHSTTKMPSSSVPSIKTPSVYISSSSSKQSSSKGKKRSSTNCLGPSQAKRLRNCLPAQSQFGKPADESGQPVAIVPPQS